MTHYEPLLIRILPLVLLLILLFPHSSLAPVELEDVETYKVRTTSTIDLQDMFYFVNKDEQVLQRKVLHEVYSGTNPIGNSIPQQKRMRRITKLHRFP